MRAPIENQFPALWLGDNGATHVLYFPSYRRTMLLKTDDVDMAVVPPA